jgi:hypothetical protein
MKITLKKVTGKPVIKDVTETMTVRIDMQQFLPNFIHTL